MYVYIALMSFCVLFNFVLFLWRITNCDLNLAVVGFWTFCHVCLLHMLCAHQAPLCLNVVCRWRLVQMPRIHARESTKSACTIGLSPPPPPPPPKKREKMKGKKTTMCETCNIGHIQSPPCHCSPVIYYNHLLFWQRVFLFHWLPPFQEMIAVISKLCFVVVVTVWSLYACLSISVVCLWAFVLIQGCVLLLPVRQHGCCSVHLNFLSLVCSSVANYNEKTFFHFVVQLTAYFLQVNQKVG